MKPHLSITYCTRCRWMFRATWMAQELLTTFETEIDSVSLKPDFSGGVFEIHSDDQLIFSRQAEGTFAELKEIKQRIRDLIAPEKNLGHSDSRD